MFMYILKASASHKSEAPTRAPTLLKKDSNTGVFL